MVVKVPSLLNLLGFSRHCFLLFNRQQDDETWEGFYEEEEETQIPATCSFEVSPSDVPKSDYLIFDPINLERGLTLLQCRVSSSNLCNADILEGLPRSSADLINTLQREVQDGALCFREKKVLELGCGHGLPGIFACLKGASTVHFQDFNKEILTIVTIPNVMANVEARQSRAGDPVPELHFIAGDWVDMNTRLSCIKSIETEGKDHALGIDHGQGHEGSLQGVDIKKSKPSFGRRACERGNKDGGLEGGYDIILMTDSVFALSSFQKLYDLLKKCLRAPFGVVYVAGRKRILGHNGYTRRFKHFVEEDGVMGAHLVMPYTERSSGSREIWKFFYRSQTHVCI